MSAAVLGMATEMKLDRKTLKDFIEGTVAKPSSATMQKFDGWRSRHIVSADKSTQPKVVAADPRDKEIAELKDLIKSKDQERENLRLKYVETMRKLEGMESLDTRKAEQYQVVGCIGKGPKRAGRAVVVEPKFVGLSRTKIQVERARKH